MKKRLTYAILKAKKGGTDRWQDERSQARYQFQQTQKHGGVTLYIEGENRVLSQKNPFAFCRYRVKRKTEVILRKDLLKRECVVCWSVW